MTMSWLAEAKATRSAKRAVAPRLAAGSVMPMSAMPASRRLCAASAQPRRRPSLRLRTGSASRSTSGAHSTLSE